MLLAKRESDVQTEEKDKLLKKREDFAISLRKKKHSEIITTKRKAFMQKAFERTTGADGLQDLAGQESALINDEESLVRAIELLD